MHDVAVTHPDKLLFSAARLTKQHLVDYYRKIAPIMLPDLAERPLTLRQFPKGIDEDGFFRKHAPKHFPGYIKRVVVQHRDPAEPEYLMATADEADDLAYLANQNVIELHVTGARAGNLSCPDQLIFDLDAMQGRFEDARVAAVSLRDILSEFQAPAFLKTSGRRGLHIHVPLQPSLSYEQLKPWVEAVGKRLCSKLPSTTTMAHLRRDRGHKVYVDLLRNNYAQTIIAPYSVRALPGAPVATPIDWAELSRRRVHSQSWTVGNIFRRLGAKADPWQSMRSSAIEPQRLLALL